MGWTQYCPVCKTRRETTCSACGCGRCLVCGYAWSCRPLELEKVPEKLGNLFLNQAGLSLEFCGDILEGIKTGGWSPMSLGGGRVTHTIPLEEARHLLTFLEKELPAALEKTRQERLNQLRKEKEKYLELAQEAEEKIRKEVGYEPT